MIQTVPLVEETNNEATKKNTMVKGNFASKKPSLGFLCGCLIATLVFMQLLTIGPVESNIFKANADETARNTNFIMNSNGNSGAKCLDFEKSFDELVANSVNVFVTMPAKAAGTAMKGFTRKCVGMYDKSNTNSNFMNGSIDNKIDNFIQRIDHPKIVTSHVFGDKPMVDIIRNAPRDSLIIYIYREEQERMLSGLREVVQTSVCTNDVYEDISAAERGDGRCVIDEMTIAKKVLQEKKAEVRFGSHNIMTCTFYDAIEQNFPKMVFIHYKYVDEMQKVLAKYHCPELLDELPIKANLKEYKQTEVFVKREKDGELMGFSEWVDAKRGMIEWTFEMYSGKGETCQAKTRRLEDDLLDCKNGLLQVTRDMSF